MDLNNLKQSRRAVEGDEISRFFHSLLKCKFANCMIRGIQVNGIWYESQDLFKKFALEHFASRFKEHNPDRPSFRNALFRKLSVTDAAFLESPFSLEEVNGFNFNFIKSFWEVVKTKFWECIKHFEASSLIAKGCNPSFTVLIPKNSDPLDFLDYRPISLIGCVYKVISKILAKRLAKVISAIVGPNQSAFIVSMVASWLTKLSFLSDVMNQMGFGSKWINWMQSCLSLASVSVLINGSSTKEFNMERGLRQGDPLSLLLFLLVAEALQVTILDACNKGIFKGVRLANSLKINLEKSRLFGVGVSIEDVELVASSIGCVHDALPFIYLGLSVGKRMRFCDWWVEVVNRIRNRLSAWKTKSLSVGGRLTLIKSILGSLPFWIKWKSMLLDTDKGGLGIGSLLAKNLSLIGKWKWCFLTEKDALWRVVIKDFYGDDGGFRLPLNSARIRGVWCDILNATFNI
ncbi:putative RNA-directed DNA polymerase [Tanacetum coccineum]